MDFLDNTDKKVHIVKARSNPFNEYNDVDFKICLRLPSVL